MILPSPPIITANGVYDLPVTAGSEYLLAIKGVYGSASVAMSFKSNANGQNYPVDGLPFTGAVDTATEKRFLAPSSQISLTVTGATGTTALVVDYVRKTK